MTTIDLNEHTRFGKIKDIFYGSSTDRNGLIEFVTNVVMDMDMTNDNNKNGYGIMLPDLSNIYVFKCKKGYLIMLLVLDQMMNYLRKLNTKKK